MQLSLIVAPFTVAAVVAGAMPFLPPAESPVHASVDITLARASATYVLPELAVAQRESHTDANRPVADSAGIVSQNGLNRTRELLLVAPTVTDGLLTISAALPGAFSPVLTALRVAFIGVVAALGTARIGAAIAAGRHRVASAVEDALTALAPVVQQVTDDIDEAIAALPPQVLNPFAKRAPSAAGAKAAASPQTRRSGVKTTPAGAKRTAGGHTAQSARAVKSAR